jgi:hypothetical protein
VSWAGKRIFVIPDTQVRPGVPTDHFDWIGALIREYEPEYVVHIGDHWDMSSLSSYAGELAREGQRYVADIEAGNAALLRLHDAMGGYKPKRKIILRGNHENRIDRAVADNPKLAGALSCDHFNDRALGWEVVDYNGDHPGIIDIEGVKFAHYFAAMNAKGAIGGTAQNKLLKIGEPYVMGHVQGLDTGHKQFATGRVIRGIVAGSCYLHDESYKGHANTHWRGVVVLNGVRNGNFGLMDIPLIDICPKFEGMSLARFLQRKRRNAKERFSLARAA